MLRIFIILMMWSFSIHATEIYQGYEDVRSLGMGGVSIPDSSDAGVIFKNPAALGQLKGINWKVFDLGLGAGGGASLVDTVGDLSSISGFSGVNSLTNLYGKNFWFGGGGYTAMAVTNFGVAVFENIGADLLLNNPAYPNMGVTYFKDYGAQVGGAFGVGPVSIGMGFKRIDRLGGTQSIGGDILAGGDTSTIQAQFNNRGVGYGFDLGATFAPDILFNPTLSMAWQDVGCTAFTMSSGATAPDRIQDNFSLSGTIHGDVTVLGFAAGMEYRHMNLSTEPLGKKIHMGAELSILMFDVRAGFYQGYTTYGLGIDLLFIQLDASIYSVERGAYAGQTPDQRAQISLSMNLGFDPNFNLNDSSGKKRKLKQRR